MVIVTGGAGFIGSCIVRMLNDMGIDDIVIVDHIGATDKWRNLCNKRYREYVGRDRFPALLPSYAGGTDLIIHMGACSATTERDFDFLYANNFAYTKMLWEFCAEHQIRFFYASSAATYGDGSMGFDDTADIGALRPLNGYGYSKHIFDLWARKQEKRPRQHVGFKFFNVYGPNEYCKGSMASVVFHACRKIMETGGMGLFRSYRDDFEDGKQMRDFVYVKDICRVVRYMMEHPDIDGLYNLGTGQAGTFYDLTAAVFRAMGREPVIRYIDMPDALQKTYQYYTQAEMDKLRKAGYSERFYSLEDGVTDYVQRYLMKGYEIY